MLPVQELGKLANTRCKHQRFRKGCAIYARKPLSCALWNCRWFVNDADDLPRPDHCGFALDIMPDFITLQDNATGKEQNVQCVQIWVDPGRPTAYRHPKLYAYLDRQWERKILGLVRFDSKRGIVLCPPAWSGADHWIEKGGEQSAEHSAKDIVETLSRL